eukprot:SAG31_NODE_1181_length_9513_cov_6.219035_5_plen_152_part_00
MARRQFVLGMGTVATTSLVGVGLYFDSLQPPEMPSQADRARQLQLLQVSTVQSHHSTDGDAHRVYPDSTIRQACSSLKKNGVMCFRAAMQTTSSNAELAEEHDVYPLAPAREFGAGFCVVEDLISPENCRCFIRMIREKAVRGEGQLLRGS